MNRDVAIVSAACASAGEIALLRSATTFAIPECGDRACLPDRLDRLERGPRLLAGSPSADAAAGEAGPRQFRASRLICDVVAMALADAGLAPEDVAGPRTGFVSGSYYGCVDFLDELRAIEREKGPRGVKPTEFAIATHGYPVAALGMIFGAQGPATAFVSGLTAGFEALGFALTMLAQQQCDRMIVIGFEIPGERIRPHRRALAGGGDAGEVVETVVAYVLERRSERPGEQGLAAIEDLRSWFEPDSDRDPQPVPESLGADGLRRLFRRLADAAPAGPGEALPREPLEAAAFELVCSDPLGPRAAIRVRALGAALQGLRERAA